jgi:hypothetical protein
MPTIAQGLARAGFSTAEPVAGTHSVRFIHRSGLPIECHLSPLRGSVYLIERSALMARTRSAIVIGSTCRVLQGGDMLAHICGHAPQNPRRRSMTWLVDAYLLIGREQALWPSFLEATMAMRVEVPALAALNYLRDRLHAPVPDAVLTELRRQTRSISSRGRRAAMRISLDARRLSVAGLWRSLCWRSRLAIRGRFTSIVQR